MPINYEYDSNNETLNIKDRKPFNCVTHPKIPNFKCPFNLDQALMNKIKKQVIEELTNNDKYNEIIYNDSDDTVLIEHDNEIRRITLENLIKYMLNNYTINELPYISEINSEDMVLVQQLEGAKKLPLVNLMSSLLSSLDLTYQYDEETETLTLVLDNDNTVESETISEMLSAINTKLDSIEERLTALEEEGGE